MSKILHETYSLCPYCLKKIPMKYVEEEGKAYIYKTCPEHGEFKVLFWNDAEMYADWKAQGILAPTHDKGKPVQKGCPFDCGICNEHHSGTCTAILEITSRCNMNCNICFADANSTQHDLTHDQIRAMYATALRENPFCSVQLSGGEPTVRDDLPEIIRMGKEMKVVHLQVNTNGIRIAQDIEYLKKLKEAGLDLIYLQFDGMDDEIYQVTRGRDILDIKMKAIENCEKVGVGVLLVPVVIPGVNLHKLGDIVAFAKAHIPTIKGIHFQPVSYFGRYPGQVPADDERCGLSDVLHALEEQTGGEMTMEHFVPRKQFDPHCDFSSTYYLDENGKLVPMSHYDQNKCDTAETDFVEKTNVYTDKRWRYQEDTEQNPTPLKKFVMRTLTHSFAISGMGFQDVWNIDMGRVQGCCVHIITPNCEVIPFCAYHLTSVDGKRLYED